MLTNSLFKDFLMDNGLTVWKGESTRDIICIQFDYGTKDYDTTISKLQGIIDKSDNDDLKKHINELIDNVTANKDKCKNISKQELRTMFYVNGIDITYRTHNRSGKVINEETIHYKMLYRTPGKAKKGTCMFINADLYDKAHEFLYMGIELPAENSPIVEIGAYASLITSSIVGKVQIKPEEMLIVKDVDTFFKTNVIKVDTDERRQCYAEEIEGYDIKSTLFDGQALIDSSIFPEWADGYILLRHHMTKCAAFSTNIELFMREKFGDSYSSAYVKDMWGRDVKVSDIKLITTDNAIKWLKFNVSFEYWSDWVRANDCMFGIVKTSHESKLGDVQRMSYQMVNSLDIDSMESVVSTSVDYINKLKTDDAVFLDYLERNTNFSNDYEVLVALCKHNSDFVRSKYFRDRKKDIIKSYILNFKSGRSIQNADNLTIVGSPYALLLHSIGENVYDDPTLQQEDGTIQCWTARFDDGEYLAEFRNPFNSRNNLGYIHNVYHEYFDKYFNLGKLCIAVNVINTDWQARNNGADQDSDSCYTTNQADIVRHAKYCYENYPTIVNEIKPEKNIYNYSMESYAAIDNSLTAAQLAIGQSSNLAQLALSYTYNFDKDSEEYKKYYHYVCILSVIAQVAIDNAKRKYAVDLDVEIPRISRDMNVDSIGLPQFWEITKKDKRKARTDEERKERQRANKERIKSKVNKDLICPMNYLYNLDFNKYRNTTSTLPMSDFFIKHEQDEHYRRCKKVEELIEKYSLDIHNFYMEYNGTNWDDEKEVYYLMMNNLEELIQEIQSVYISKNYLGLMSWLINRAFCIGSGIKSKIDITDSNLNKNKSLLLKVLYSINPDLFLQCFVKKCGEQAKNDI